MSLPEPQQLAELGYRVFPIVAGGKNPIPENGLKAATTDADTIDAWLEECPGCNWAISTDGLLVIDTDPGAEQWPNDVALAQELAATPLIATTPRGGKHYYFRQPEGLDLRNTQSRIGEHVDTRANGGYVLASPSSVNGSSYRWVNGDPETRPEQLPVVPQWVLTRLTAEFRKDAKAIDATNESDVGEGQRNGKLTKLAGAMRRVGSDLENMLVALSDYNSRRCKPPLEPKEVETIANSVARYAPADVRHALPEIYDDEAAELAARSPEDPGPVPDELLRVPGFISDIIEHNLRGAYREQPVLALAGAISLLAVLTGRKVTDTQGTRTNLYCVSLAGTSMGKERARVVNKEILHEAGLERLIGAESIGSSQGLVASVVANPAILFQLDEIGRYMKTMRDAKDAHLYGVVSVLMRMFTDAGTFFKSDALADMKRAYTIPQPCACIYGTSTKEAFYDALTLDSLQDGFLSRVLIFEGDDEAAKRYVSKPELPRHIVEQAAWWGNFNPGGNLSHVNPKPLVVPMTASARAIMYEYDSTAQFEERRLGKPIGCVWPRVVEKANKLALLYACSESPQSPVITDAAALWATELTSHLTQMLAFQASRRLSENRIEYNLKRVFRLIEDSGEGLTKTAIYQKTEWLAARERTEILDNLITSGKVAFIELPAGPKGGRPRTVYTARKVAAG